MEGEPCESLISLVMMLYGQGGQVESSTISPPYPHSGSAGLFQRGGRGSSQCRNSQNVSITLTTSGQFLCRFTPSCLSTCSSLCPERIKLHPPGQLLLGGLLKFRSGITYLDLLSAPTCPAYISTQYPSHCTVFGLFFPSFLACLFHPT